MLLVLVILILLFVLWKMGLGAGSREFAMGMFMRTKHKLNITAIMMQIATTMSPNLSISFPLAFAEFIGAFNFVNINPFQVIAFGCIEAFNFYHTLLCMTITPLVASALLLGRFWYKKAKKEVTHTFAYVLILLFFVLPSVSSTIFSVYKCRYFEDSDEYWLVADLSIECDGDDRFAWLFYTAIMVLIYPIGITAFFAVLLYRERNQVSCEERQLPH
jgi:hypothetical protein